MRKQYHFRKSERGLLAWDVHRLVELSRHIQPEEIPVSTLQELDEPYWFEYESPTSRQIIDHMRLVHTASLDYPIILCPEGKLMDGMHRVARAVLEGRSHIRAVRLIEMPEPAYIGAAPADLPYDG